MKKLLFTCLCALMTTLAFGKDLQTLIVTTKPVMTCSKCENRIKGYLKFEKGIKAIKTDIPSQTITITYDADSNTSANIIAAFGKIGYTATEVQATDAAAQSAVKNTQNGAKL